MKNLLMSFLFGTIMLFNLQSFAKAKKTIIRGSINLSPEYLVQISDLFDRFSDNAAELVLDDKGKFQYTLYTEVNQYLEVSILPISKDRQLGATFPLFVKPGEKIDLKINYSQEDYLKVEADYKKNENNAFIDYSGFVNRKIKELFLAPKDSDNNLNEYFDYVNKVISKYAVKNSEIKEYLQLWAYNSYLSSFYSGRRNETLPLEVVDQIPLVFNSRFALTFYNTSNNINSYLNSFVSNERDRIKRLSLKAKKMKELFGNEELVSRVLESDLQRYISSYKITNIERYNQDIELLKEVLDEINIANLKTRVLQDFSNLINTSVGSFTPDVKFKDLKGNEVSLQDFRGKYIYIDLWASWCVPCIKEIPFLQELEKDYKDKDIVFVSISIDEKKEAWRKKVQELDLHGYQWEVSNSNFDKIMNVSGIPHFLLYGPDGKLIRYQAPRPSSAEIRSIFGNL